MKRLLFTIFTCFSFIFISFSLIYSLPYHQIVDLKFDINLPEPLIQLFFGLALIGIAMLGRKKFLS